MPPGGTFIKRLGIVTSQVEQLRKLVATVFGQNPFYTAKLNKAGVSAKVRDLGDFTDSFPFTTKAEISEDQRAHPPYGTNLTYPLDRYIRCHQTSGTSGAPVRWLDTPESWDWMLRNWQQVYTAAGVTRSDVIFFAFGFGPFLGFWTAFEAAARSGVLSLPGGGMSSVARVRAIFEHKASVLCSTPTYAMRLAEVAANEGFDLTASPVKLLILAGEPGGSIPGTRARLEQLWPGARVYDHHGMTEVGPVTYECPIRPGVLHVIETSYVAEIIDPQTGQAVESGTLGELILTPLGRAGSPLLRYRTGDLVKAALDSICECGRHDLALEGGILGRTDDMMIVRGVNIHPSAVEEIVRGASDVVEYRVNVTMSDSLAELAVDVEFDPAVTNVDQRLAGLEAAFQRVFSMRVPVLAAAPGSLPRAEAKSKRWNKTTR